MDHNNSEQYDVVIVGGGLVGATLACLLQELPLRIALLDQHVFDASQSPIHGEQSGFDARVSAITEASRALLQQVGAWQHIQSLRSCGYSRMQVWDADGTGAVHFSAADINQPQLGHIIENSIILEGLYQQLKARSRVSLLAPMSITSIKQTVSVKLGTAEGETLQANLVIAADGGNSLVRELAGITTNEWDYDHEALVTTVKTEFPHCNTAMQRFMSSGPLAFLPLQSELGKADSHFSSIVWSMTPDMAAEIHGLPDAEFCQRLENAIEQRLGKVEWSAARFKFPLRQRHAMNYFKDNIVLVGDAAHTIHPLAGQGVNLGLLDARVLAEELSVALSAGRLLADPVVLRRYQRRRKGHNLGMMWLMEGFKHLFAEQSLPVLWLRNMGMTGVDSLPLIKQQLARRAMGLDWS